MEKNQESVDQPESTSGLNNAEKKKYSLKIDTTAAEIEFRKICEKDDDFKNMLNFITCSICKTSLKHVHKHKIYKHPLMDVLLCKSCLDFYSSGDFSLDEDDEDKYCRWCGEGGKIFLCSKCICGFCPKCIRRNFGSKKVNEIKNDEDWNCFVCNPEPLWKLRAICYFTMKSEKPISKKDTLRPSSSSSPSNAKEGNKTADIEKDKTPSRCKTKVVRDNQKRSIEIPSNEEMKLSDEMSQRKRRKCSKTESSLISDGKDNTKSVTRRTRTTSETPELATRKISKSQQPIRSRQSRILRTDAKNDKTGKSKKDSSDSDSSLESSSDTESADEAEPRNRSNKPLGSAEEKLQDILKIAEVTSEFSLKTCRKKLKRFSDGGLKGSKESVLEEVKSVKSVILLLSSSLSTALNISNLLEEKLSGELEGQENDSVKANRKNEDQTIDIASLLKMILEFMLKEKIKATYLLEIIDDICNKYHNIGISSHSLFSNFLKSMMKKTDVNVQSVAEPEINSEQNTKDNSGDDARAACENNDSHQIITADKDKTNESTEKNQEEISNEPREDSSVNVSRNDAEILEEPDDISFGNDSNNDSENIPKKHIHEKHEVISTNAEEQISEESNENNFGNVSNNDSENISKKHTNQNLEIASSNMKQISKELTKTSSGNISNDQSEDISKKSNEESAEIASSNVTDHMSKESNKNTFGNVSNIDSEVISENSNENRSGNHFVHNDLEIISKEPNSNRYGTNSNNLEVILRGPNENTLGNVNKVGDYLSTSLLGNGSGFKSYMSYENFCMIPNQRGSGQSKDMPDEETGNNSILSNSDRKVEETEFFSSDPDFDISELEKIREELLKSESSFESDSNMIQSSSSDSSCVSTFMAKRPRHQKHTIKHKAKEKRKKPFRSDMSNEERELRKLLDFSSLERTPKISNSSRSKPVNSNGSDSALKITEEESNIGKNFEDNATKDKTVYRECSINTFDETDNSYNSYNDSFAKAETEYISDEADISDTTIDTLSDDDLNTISLIMNDVENANLKNLDLKTTLSEDINNYKDENDEDSNAKNIKDKDDKTLDAENDAQENDEACHFKSPSKANTSGKNSSHNSKKCSYKKKSDASWKRDKLLRKISEDTNSDEQDSSRENNKGKKIEEEKRNEKSVYDFSDSDSTIPERKTFGNRKPLDSPTSEDTSSSGAEVQVISNPEQSPIKGRRNIKKILNQQSLHLETKQALKIENERKKRVAERNEIYNKLFPNIGDSDRLVLDFNPDTKEILLEVPENLVKNLKPHQKQGVKFMWDCCFESIDSLKTNNGTGCILAHCMGLGKTLQVVTLIYTLLDYNLGLKTVLIACPLNVLNNWLQEFVIWWSDCPKDFVIYSIQNLKKKGERYSKIKKWYTSGGILILSYNMIRNLVKQVTKNKCKKKKYDFSYFLHDPGPDIVICDEGHLMKNEDSGLSKCMRKIRTSRRIVLTGTPFQNNLLEYYSMIQFVKPNILGTKMEFMNRFGNPIKNGQFEDSTDSDVALMRARSHVLHKLLDGCIQRFNYNVAIPFLPEKHEYVISIQLTKTQATLYKHYIEKCRQRTSLKNEGYSLFRDFTWLHKLWTHPLALVYCTRHRLINDKYISLEPSNDELNFPEVADSNDEDLNSSNTNEKFWESEIKPEEYEDYKSSGKLFVLLSLLKYCKEVGDKVLVFSQSLYVLNLIEHFLKKINCSYFEKSDEIPIFYRDTWVSGVDYYRLDGSTNSKIRSKFCKAFNKSTNKRGRLFLISTKAGGLGINLVGANRVVIFDVSWNPSYDVQSIFRVYRFGQRKPCYFYRFFAEGTMEEKIYERQVTKLSLEKRVLDEHQIERHYTERDIQELYKYDPLPKEKWVIPKLPKDVLLAKILNLHKDIIVGYHEHDSLLENKEEEELTEEERRAAWEDFEAEKFSNDTKIQKQAPQPANSSNQMENDLMQDFWRIMSQYKANQVVLPEVSHTESNQYYSTQYMSMVNMTPSSKNFDQSPNP